MPVEVNVQDYFGTWSADQGAAFGPAYSGVDAHLAATVDAAAAIAPTTWQVWFERWLNLLQPQAESGQPLHPRSQYELSLRLTGDREVQALNQQFRQQDQPTDVLAFAALEVDCPKELPDFGEAEPLYLGDIAISVETATRQADQLGHSLQTELAWLAAHGLLHLLGWDHPDDQSLALMLSQQQVLLEAVGLVV